MEKNYSSGVPSILFVKLRIRKYFISRIWIRDMKGEKLFDSWAEAYRIIHGPGGVNLPGLEDTSEYLEEAERISGKILEVGCGTGRIYLQLLEDGHDAVGIDVSQDCLDILRDEADERGLDPNVFKKDMRMFSLDSEFELIIVPYNTFRDNTTPSEQLKCLTRIREHLSDTGKAIFEFSRPEPEWSSIPRTLKSEFTYEGDEFLYLSTLRISDEVEQILETERKLFKNGRIAAETDNKLARIYKREFEHLLQRAGFDEWDVYGGFDKEEVSENEESKSMVWEVFCSGE